MPAVPLLGDVSLQMVQRIEHALDAGWVPTRIAGLAGELQQRAGRPSHHIHIAGVLAGADAAEQLKSLQQAAAAGEELTFAADIASALDLQQVVITGFRAVEVAGEAGRFAYHIDLAESPPLPPPAELSGFGGLDDFGLGDLGFDTDLLGDLEDLAGDIADAVNTAMDVVSALDALSNLSGLDLSGGFLDPVNQAVGRVSAVAESLRGAARDLSEAFGS
jgi:hypothetical protein